MFLFWTVVFETQQEIWNLADTYNICLETKYPNETQLTTDQAKSYYGEHVLENGAFAIELSNELSNEDLAELQGSLSIQILRTITRDNWCQKWDLEMPLTPREDFKRQDKGTTSCGGHTHWGTSPAHSAIRLPRPPAAP
ncbi:hypothetical protein RR48_02493 [Papilio machaon]|uniref:Uncharacterized protein n=1 Tax=Papilio machaon TaxID=76193 RepID=A0A0N1IF56_PAPMA|nr:hypothetical protein RR48_02493 [Papilio machaon]